MIEPVASTELSLNFGLNEQLINSESAPKQLQTEILGAAIGSSASAFPIERRRPNRRPQDDAAMLNAILHAIDQRKPLPDNPDDLDQSCLTTQFYKQF